MGAHINAAGQFQSDKYPSCPPGKVPLSVKDPAAQDLLWLYAQRRRAIDAEFSDDLELVLQSAGYGLQHPSLMQRIVVALFGHHLSEAAQEVAERVITRAIRGDL